MRQFACAAVLLASGCAAFLIAGSRLPPLQVSRNARFLVTSGERPFFWLGDTCWRLISKASLEDAADQPAVDRYFEDRAAKRFNVIQTRFTGTGVETDVYGHAPFEPGDFGAPRVVEGPRNDYWDIVDAILARGEERGFYFAMLPVWADSVGNDHQWVKEPASAYRYGSFLGRRYGQRPSIVWVLGGDMHRPDRGVEDPARLKMIRAMAEGIADGSAGISRYDGQAPWDRLLMTFHPPGGNRSSSQFLHHEPWLDFNMVQTTTRFEFASYENIQRDYARTPVKPVLEAEAAYEDSLPINAGELKQRPGQRTTAWEARRAAYWTVFAGGFGFTYGHRSFIAWMRKGETGIHGAHIPWYESLDAPGAGQMRHLRALMESRPFLDRVPDDDLIVDARSNPPDRLAATRDAARSYAMVYAPTGKTIRFAMSGLRAASAVAWWFDPRTGEAQRAGEVAAAGTIAFEPPSNGPAQDWVLVLDDASRGYPPPGSVKRP